MAAPGGIELNENVLVAVEGDLLEVPSDEGVDVAILGLRNGLRLERGQEESVNEVLDLLLDSVGGDFLGLVEGVLEALFEVLNDEGGELDLEVQGTSVVGVLGGVYPDKVELALELLSNGADGGDNGILLSLGGGVDEEVGEGLATGGVDGVVLGGDLVKSGDGELGEPALDLLLGGALDGVRVFRARSIERAVNNDGRGNDASSSGGISVRDNTEEIVVTVSLGSSRELSSGDGIGGGEVGNSDNPVRLDEFSVLLGGDLRNGREGLPAGSL